MRAAALVLAACGAAQPPQHVDNARPVAPGPPDRVAAARPVLDLAQLLPDATHEGRWPLAASSHPELEPKLDVAGALAHPGVTWIDLCRLGAQSRRMPGQQDLITYLHGWCNALRHEPEAALDDLVPLRTSLIPGMREAVALDIADIVVEAGSASFAERLLARAHVVDADVLDLVSAAYIEIGDAGDAFELNERAIDAGSHDPRPRRCHRVAKRVVLGATTARKLNLKTLADLDDGSHDDTCHALMAECSCWADPANSCTPYLKATHGDDQRYAMLFAAYYGWPAGPATYTAWSKLSTYAIAALGLPGADALAVIALEAAHRASICGPVRTSDVRQDARKLLEARHDPALHARVLDLASLPSPSC